MDTFRIHRLGIQEGPTLSGNKLTADLERGWEGEHELTEADVRDYVHRQSMEEARRAELRKPPRQRTELTEAQRRSPWRNSGAE
jgi:hypothetical protein